VVCEGAFVREGDLIAITPEKALGANLHASISGQVTAITAESIILEA
jgi:Na+-translocating ferredoxin:NAD+ oxidoreductase RnfC subunit